MGELGGGQGPNEIQGIGREGEAVRLRRWLEKGHLCSTTPGGKGGMGEEWGQYS